MAFDNVNVLRRIIEVQSIVLENKKRGRTQKWVYNNLIKDQFFISFSTFNRYLSLNAKRLMKEKQLKCR